MDSLELGQSYRGVVKVISISILYHTMRLDEKENTDFIHYGTTELIGMHTKKPLVLHKSMSEGDKVCIVTGKEVFPEYYMIYVEKFNDMINDAIDEWVYFFKYGKILDDFKSPGILLAAQKLDYLMMNEKDRRAYDNYLAYLGQELGILDTAREEGIKEGIKEKAREIARNLIDILDDEIISKKTGLSIDDIKKLRKQ